MFKKIFVAALAATLALGASAQDKMYLIKGNEVVAKYNVTDVDYVSFTLPDGVTDNTGDEPSVVDKTYASAVGSYLGTTDAVADYQIQLSTREINDGNTPVEFLYLQCMGPAADYNDLSLPVGTYTLQNGDTRAPFTYYAGVRQTTPQGENVGGTIIIERPTNDTTISTLVEGGYFTVSKDGNNYTIAGLFKLDNGSSLEFSYTGACVVDNNSDEKDPADYLPLPESTLTEDMTAPTADVYYGTHGAMFQDKPNLQYNYIWMYDANYEQCLELGFFVDDSKAGEVFIPKGKYQLVSVGSAAYNNDAAGALAPFAIKTDTGQARYGCWFVTNYADNNPLVSGEIEVLEDYKTSGNLNIKFTLKDNSATPHTVSGSYNGRASKL